VISSLLNYKTLPCLKVLYLQSYHPIVVFNY